MFKSNQIAVPSPASSPLGNKINHAFKNRNSAFPEIEQKISELFDEAEAEGQEEEEKEEEGAEENKENEGAEDDKDDSIQVRYLELIFDI